MKMFFKTFYPDQDALPALVLATLAPCLLLQRLYCAKVDECVERLKNYLMDNEVGRGHSRAGQACTTAAPSRARRSTVKPCHGVLGGLGPVLRGQRARGGHGGDHDRVRKWGHPELLA